MNWLILISLAFTAYKLGENKAITAGTPQNPTLSEMLDTLVRQGKLSQADAQAILRSAAMGVLDQASLFKAIVDMIP